MQNAEAGSATRKKVMGRAIVVFSVMMILLTFFSNTINNFTLPRVRVERPANGSLVMEISGEGTVEAGEDIDIYADSGRKVEELMVELNDTVKKGQTLAILEKESIVGELEVERLRLEKLKLALEKLTDSTQQNSLVSYERNVESARLRLEDTQKVLETKKKLYEAGAESAENLRTAEKDYEDAKRSLEQKEEDYATAKSDQAEKAKENERDIRDKQLDIQIQDKKIADLQEQLDSKSVVAAPADGVITQVNLSKGGMTGNNQPSFKMANTGKGFEIKIMVDSDKAGYLKQGEEIEVRMTSLGDKIIKGKLTEIKDSEQQRGEKKELVISLADEMLAGGETGEIYVEKKTKSYMSLVPNEAICEDNDGKYVLVVRERKGPLGNESYLQRANIQVTESDSSKSAVEGGVGFLERMVVSSSKSVSEGSQVIVEK